MSTCPLITGSPPPDEGEEEEEFGSDGVQSAGQSHSNLSGRDVVTNFRIGTRVIRGPDWKWGDQVNKNFPLYIVTMPQNFSELRLFISYICCIEFCASE